MLLHSVLKELFREHLNDPVNWVAFIHETGMDMEEARWWRDHLNLEHAFSDDFGA
ncbi:hypothetical protein [Vibrio barjaei]|uniref:hypothetical protein n=1 Tax=Vibrio barjaei TaxID=1676683 RepID=UPI000AA91323|nr:hypothetical protein [Vibrio barjaei]